MAIKLSAASTFRGPLPPPRSGASIGTVTLIEKCSGAVGFEAVATDHRWVVHISGGSVGRGDLTPVREPVGHLGSPLGRAEHNLTVPIRARIGRVRPFLFIQNGRQ